MMLQLHPSFPSITDYHNKLSSKFKEYLKSNCFKKTNPEEPLITVITVVFNGQQTLQRTINSIKEQTYKNIEYIVIDGGSNDKTLEIIKSNKENISFWISEKDNGIYDAMNKGISIAKGELIGLLNADDFYVPDAIEHIVDSYKKNRGEVIHGNVNYIENKNIKFTLKPPAEITVASFTEMPLNHPATFVQRKVYEEIGLYKTSYRIAADWEFILRAFIRNKTFSYIPKTLTNYTLEGISSTQAILGINEIFGTLSELKLLPPHRLFISYQVAKAKLLLRDSNNRFIRQGINAYRKLKKRTTN